MSKTPNTQQRLTALEKSIAAVITDLRILADAVASIIQAQLRR